MKGVIIAPDKIVFINLIFLIFGFSIIWFGILLFFLIDRIMEEIPNSPDSNGKSGSFSGMLNVKYPRKPDIRKIIRAGNIFSSLNIK